MMAQNDKGPTSAGGWLRVVVIGRNPKLTMVRVVILVVVFKFILLPVKIQGISMLPTYKDKRINFINHLAYLRREPQRGDVVGIRLSGTNAIFRTPGVMYMKRIVGLPGETVAFVDGRLLIDGTPFDEPYVKNRCDWNSAPDPVGSNQYYVVGDNRSMPQEDHEHGKAEKEQIVGKVLF
jgi:signal peptidase I